LFSKLIIQRRGKRRGSEAVIASRLGCRMVVACIGGIGFAAIVTMLLTLPRNHGCHPSAVLYVADPIIEVGVLAPGEVRDVVCPIVNMGDHRLVINERDRGCGCAESVLKTLLISPGAKKDLAVSIDTRFERGAIEKLVSFTTNDPAQPRFDLLIKAAVDPVRDLDGTDADPRQDFSILTPRQQHADE
jgi:hypothetical protein